MNIPPDLSDVEKAILAHANKVVSERDGEPITNVDLALRTLNVKMLEKPELAARLVGIYGDASKAELHTRLSRALELQAYKDHWGPKFDRARELKRPLPNIFPDPDDIVIRADLSFTFLGPVTPSEAKDWKFYQKFRDMFSNLVKEINDCTLCVDTHEDGLAEYLKLRRKYYRFNRYIPKIFKVKYPWKFPPFEPTPGCPEGWYDDPTPGNGLP